ncbi:hypothetical protein T12_664 [Trichinella patagoniensis]|uniref:Uncharacterized protein n=1 Tax=Trichinella patagoniensis TaxID=990121 RepID=A0A0V0ZD55_9BILA|nr:hypothetical protein T12_664 [Trichinella patagoniensis]
MSDKPNEGLSHSCLKLDQQKEISATQLMPMRHICDAAAQKKLFSFKQNLNCDYIKYDPK